MSIIHGTTVNERWKMNKRIAVLALGFWLAGPVVAAPAVGCAAKRDALVSALSEARAHDNDRQVAGLQEALNNVEAYCDDGALLKESDSKLAELKTKVDERLSELQSARVEGKPDKIAKKQTKLDEAQAKYQQEQIHNGALRALVDSKSK
jgi:hypothetical protein